jgi:hypothetical protein
VRVELVVIVELDGIVIGSFAVPDEVAAPDEVVVADEVDAPDDVVDLPYEVDVYLYVRTS